jgi:hypothetical protein
MDAMRRPLSRLSSLAARPFARLRIGCLLLGIAAFAACEDAAAPNEFLVTPDTATLFVGNTLQLTAVGAPGTVAWSSSNSQVASVISETGFVRALGRGDVTISAVSGSAVATAEVAVRVPPALGLSAPTVTFEKTLGDVDPAAQTVTVRNTGDGVIANVALGAVAYGAGEPTGWLTAGAGGATAPVTVTLNARGQGLGRGTYTASLPVQASGIDNSPQTLAVTFRVLAQASIAPARDTVRLAGTPGAVIRENVEINNGGDRPLTGLATSITYQAGQPQGWLAVALSATTAPTTAALTATTGTLPVGNYRATLRVTSTVAGVAARDIVVLLSVAPGPAIQLSRTTVAVTAINTFNPAAQTVTISNSGGGTLSGLALGAIQYGAGQPTGWISGAFSSTTAPSTLTLSFTTAAMGQGNYSATVPVVSAVASNSPANITVTLTIGPPPVIAINPSVVLFSMWKGAPALPATQGVQVTSATSGQLSGLAFSVVYAQGQPSGWLTTSWDNNNTTAPTTLLLRPNTANLPEGTLTATITISTSIPNVTPRVVTVSYIVQSFTVNVIPQFSMRVIAGYACIDCHNAGQPPNVTAATAQQIYNSVVGYVVKGSPNTSELIQRITGGAPHSGGSTLPASVVNTLRSWILGGAPFN